LLTIDLSLCCIQFDHEDPKELHLRLVAIDKGDHGDQERTFEVRAYCRTLLHTVQTCEDELPHSNRSFTPHNKQVRLQSSYLTEALEVTGPGPHDKQFITLTLRPPSNASLWELLLAHSPLPPTLLLMAGGLAVLLLGVLLVAVGGVGGGGGGAKGTKED
jgi:hypothetical protein